MRRSERKVRGRRTTQKNREIANKGVSGLREEYKMWQRERERERETNAKHRLFIYIFKSVLVCHSQR